MWQTRGAKKYFYLVKRVDGRPRTIYMGAGLAAEVPADEFERRKKARETAVKDCAVQKARIAVEEKPLSGLCRGLDELLAVVLLTLGYHRHDRGTWRLRRDNQNSTKDTADTSGDPAGVTRDDCGSERG